MVWLTSLGADCYGAYLKSYSIFLLDSEYGAVFFAIVCVATMIYVVPRMECIWASAMTRTMIL
jgi:hypothetical protein